ncbi:VPLPA-CTERM sorting domain-containing protein [Actibacterium sp. 188UL27-1]|uniref:VPLPA-CTERM sorting domain-containing protein n=1 Tax=Actibacterium sp. 188UL27-1 TaxID=2786961 RepID=UPI00195CB678|nr:VPLPA-CTERM sorting domain-containing protein [Actibacterium sp. 188UL27-1]MBM7066977.1 VPLPA-CTERM sorting domain-containing protein [Actibacterium sp. 188UL27-1]
MGRLIFSFALVMVWAEAVLAETFQFRFTTEENQVLSATLYGFPGPLPPDIPNLVDVKSISNVRVNGLDAPEIKAVANRTLWVREKQVFWGLLPYSFDPEAYEDGWPYINLLACTDSLETCEDGFALYVLDDDPQEFFYWGGPSFDLGLDPDQPISLTLDPEDNAASIVVYTPIPASGLFVLTALGLLALHGRRRRAG